MKNCLIALLLVFPGVDAFSRCGNPTGNVIAGTATNYNCHQYVRAALVKNWVNMSTGYPSNQSLIPGLSNSTIEADNDFIKVCDRSQAKLVSMNHNDHNADHSAIVLNGGFYSNDYGDFASTPGTGTPVYRHGHARTSTTACSHSFFTTTTSVIISGSSYISPGTIHTYTVTGLPSFMSVTWQPVPSHLQFISSTATSITVKGLSSGSGAIKLNLSTACSSFSPVKEKSVTVAADCNGTLNGNQLNTFNYVGYGSANTVEMNAPVWTWVKTSGTTSYWYTGSSGKYLYFAVPSGCVTFNAYNSSCNITRTFCASGSYSSSIQLAPMGEDVEYEVINIVTGKPEKSGLITDPGDTQAILEGLPAGFYVISVNGNRKKVVVSGSQ